MEWVTYKNFLSLLCVKYTDKGQNGCYSESKLMRTLGRIYKEKWHKRQELSYLWRALLREKEKCTHWGTEPGTFALQDLCLNY